MEHLWDKIETASLSIQLKLMFFLLLHCDLPVNYK